MTRNAARTIIAVQGQPQKRLARNPVRPACRSRGLADSGKSSLAFETVYDEGHTQTYFLPNVEGWCGASNGVCFNARSARFTFWMNLRQDYIWRKWNS